MDSQQQMTFNRVGISDPAVENIVGASLLVPEGWTLGGGFHWMPDFALQANLLIQVSDPGTGASVFTLPFQQFVWTTQSTLLPIGSNYLGSVLLPPPRDAVEFVRMFYLPGPLQHLGGARIVQGEDLPKLAADLTRTLGGQRTARVTRLRHVYEWGGRSWEEDVYITLAYSPPGDLMKWWGYGHAMRAPAGELDRMLPVLAVPMRSLRFTLEWEATCDYVRSLFQQRAWGSVMDSIRLGNWLRQNREELRRTHQQAWEERQAIQDRQNFIFRETLGGIETYKNPFDSHTVELPAGYRHQWVSPQGQVILSNNPLYDPRQGSTVDWRNMERYMP
ncbi:MAG: hypothetical protein QOH06_3892 [Acidobacteriota bacterium]|jgi:hypothetical protein|nr:hypothetical protein [Acidobacteriota bacterium]